MDERARAAAADSQQADYLRYQLRLEGEDCSMQLKEHARMLTDCMQAGGNRAISHHRRRIRELENEARSISRMLDALDARFPRA
jgi:hypothetical protein